MPVKLPSFLIIALSTCLTLLLNASTPGDVPPFGQTETSITSDTLRLESTEEENHFHFNGNVSITSNNLSATCDRMEVISSQKSAENSEGDSQKMSDIGDISVIYAYGNVIIEQGSQKAEAEKAIIYPRKSYIELIDNVVIVNEKGTVKGPRFIWEKDKPAYIPTEKGKRPTIQLNMSLPDLTEVDLSDKEKEESSEEDKKNKRKKK